MFRFFATFMGWLVAAATNSHAPKFFGVGALLAIGAALQVIPHTLRAWQPPFTLFALTFFISGLGQAYQDSHANTFVSTVKGAHRWLGFIHAMYGLGLLVSPFVATAVATSNMPSRWTLFYLFPLGLSVLNLVLVLVAFRDSVNMTRRDAGSADLDNQSRGRNGSAMQEVRQMMKLTDLWVFSLFFFFYLGVCTTSGGGRSHDYGWLGTDYIRMDC
jgi:fucose permease